MINTGNSLIKTAKVLFADKSVHILELIEVAKNANGNFNCYW